MASIVYTVILLVSFLFLMKKKSDTESYFPLKIMGYFVLGSFAFNLNHISLPLGFVVYLIFFRPKLNVDVKRIATIIGVLALILTHWVLPFAIHVWESRPTIIEHKLGSVFTLNFQDENELIKQELNLDNNSLSLEDFEVDYVKNGRITDLRWQLIEQSGNIYNLYKIQYDVSKSRYQVMYHQLDTWPQFNRLIDADRFFENLKVLNIKDITHTKGDFSSYGIQSSGERENYAVENQTHFIVSNGKIQLLDDKLLPVEGYNILTYAMEKTGEERDKQGHITQESFESAELSNYLFDVEFGEE
ncbi:hypothetical protein J7E81_12855 [Bacillus sp. ISL-18]|uniref:hypothetical protein n=1 Tax=Bacillus sp. ISL-18 TaxID=2819118 RepID=UPI001BE84A65|nr:hypothetical protein [Bacillus sp. ISL-18]MBT2656104.1 hypothetical protein [Bacillus sp. ISL-18]